MKSTETNERVSVIIPVYNRESLVTRSLDSIAAQSYRPIDLFIVDNNSTDNSLAVIQKWTDKNSSPDFKVTILSEHQPGASAARNRGARESNTDKLMFFDSDDTLRPDTIATAMKEFALHPETALVIWRAMMHPLSGKPFLSHHSRSLSLTENHLVHATLRTQGYMLTRDMYDRSGGWEQQALVWNDWELGLRILSQKPRYRMTDITGCDIYAQATSITGTGFAAKAGQWEKTLDMAEQRSPDPRIRIWIDYRRMILAARYRREGYPQLAEKLKRETLAGKPLPIRTLLSIIYHYTASGGRGAYLILKLCHTSHTS